MLQAAGLSAAHSVRRTPALAGRTVQFAARALCWGTERRKGAVESCALQEGRPELFPSVGGWGASSVELSLRGGAWLVRRRSRQVGKQGKGGRPLWKHQEVLEQEPKPDSVSGRGAKGPLTMRVWPGPAGHSLASFSC